MSNRKVVICISVVASVIVTLFSSYFFVWPLDFFKTEPTVLHSMDLGDGTTSEVLQILTSDFYYTGLRLKNGTGEVHWEITIDPDGPKWWPWQCSQKLEGDEIVVMHRDREFKRVLQSSGSALEGVMHFDGRSN